jgi:chromosome segregation ATPase
MISDIKDEVSNAIKRREIINTSHSAIKGAMSLIKAESSEKEDFYKQIQKYREEKEKVIIEESNVGGMIRELREDRDRLLEQVTQISAQFKEQEQTLLTLRATLEEARIENSILKKRQSKEFDEAKYQVEIYEDRMNQAIESAKLAEEKVIKLQQSIRIDFNQVKQREKELESKLELLMMDFDAQVKSRDQKILDLRRKVDSLEFNLESTNLREQKTIDEKKRVEDRLTKIMKTLKHSLHTLEDEVDVPLAKTGNKKR